MFPWCSPSRPAFHLLCASKRVVEVGFNTILLRHTQGEVDTLTAESLHLYWSVHRLHGSCFTVRASKSTSGNINTRPPDKSLQHARRPVGILIQFPAIVRYFDSSVVAIRATTHQGGLFLVYHRFCKHVLNSTHATTATLCVQSRPQLRGGQCLTWGSACKTLRGEEIKKYNYEYRRHRSTDLFSVAISASEYGFFLRKGLPGAHVFDYPVR